eukprot:XP_008758186.1 PREDICTED: phosphatidylinositide phosphatase SAC2-like [Rattus norvegicus]
MRMSPRGTGSVVAGGGGRLHRPGRAAAVLGRGTAASRSAWGRHGALSGQDHYICSRASVPCGQPARRRLQPDRVRRAARLGWAHCQLERGGAARPLRSWDPEAGWDDLDVSSGPEGSGRRLVHLQYAVPGERIPQTPTCSVFAPSSVCVPPFYLLFKSFSTDLLLAWNPICLGLVEGVIGKIQLHSDLPWWLILIRQKALVGKLPGDHEVCKVTKIAVLSLSEMEPQELELELCKKHHFGINKPEKIVPSPDDSKFLLKTFTNIKSNVSAPNKKKVKESKEKEKLERRLLEELLKMFMDSESFYYSLTYDLTNSVQRQSTGEKDGRPLWQKVDDRFFWNKYMIQDLSEIGVSRCF